MSGYLDGRAMRDRLCALGLLLAAPAAAMPPAKPVAPKPAATKAATSKALAVKPATAKPAPAKTGGGLGSAFELSFWQSVNASNDIAQFDAYLARYPKGNFAKLARIKIAALTAKEEASSATASTEPYIAEGALGTVALPPSEAPAPVAPIRTSASASAAATPSPPTPATPAEEAVAAASAMPAQAQAPAIRRESSPAAVRAALPLRPRLVSFRPIEMPRGFCSLASRDDYYTRIFRPAADAAADNDRKVNAFQQAVQVQFDRYKADGDTTGVNITAQEGIAYEETASAAFRANDDFNGKYDAIMKLPVGGCR